MTDDAISPLRRRMIEDMTVRGFIACTQRGYIAAVRRFTVFLGRSPDQATAEDLRRFQLQMRVEASRSNALKKARCPKRIYRQWHKIENFFCRIKDWRRLATRFDKLAPNFLAATCLVAALYWITL